MVTVDWSNEEELLKEEAEEEKAEEEKKEEEKKAEAAKEDEKKTEEELLADDKEKKEGEEAMDTSTENKEQTEEKKEPEWEKTLLTTVLRTPVKITNIQIRDLLSRELQHVLHKSMNTQIDFSNKKGIIHLNFMPKIDRIAVDILKKLAKFQFSNKEVKIQCSRSVAALLGFELRRQGIGPSPPGTLQFDKVLFLYDIPAETTEEVLRAMFECPICIVPLDDEGNNLGAAFLEFRSKKASKQCFNDNKDVEIGDVKVTLHNKYQFVGKKEEEEKDENEEKEKRKREQDRKSKDGQKRNQNQRGRGGAGKSFNRSQAVKQKYNQARQMGAFGGGGGMGYGGGRMGGGGGRMRDGVSQNLMMNQMMAMMRMSQGMGGDSGMSRGMGNRMGGGGMGRMGSGGGYDDYGGDYGFDDYESGYNQNRNMGGRRQPQSLMGGHVQRRGSFGSNEKKDSVVGLFESALDAVDSQIGGKGNRNRHRSLSEGRNKGSGGRSIGSGVGSLGSGGRNMGSGGRKIGSVGGNMSSGRKNIGSGGRKIGSGGGIQQSVQGLNRQKLQAKRNIANVKGKYMEGNRKGMTTGNARENRFNSPGKKNAGIGNKPISLLESGGNLNYGGNRNTGFGQDSFKIYGDSRKSKFGQKSDLHGGKRDNSRFGQKSDDGYSGKVGQNNTGRDNYSGYGQGRNDYVQGYSDSYTQGSSDSYGQGHNSNYGQSSSDSYGQSRIDNYGQGSTDTYGQGHTDSYGQGSTDSYGQSRTDSYGQGRTYNYGQGHTDNYAQGSSESYGQGYTDNYGQGRADNYSQVSLGNYGQGQSGYYGQSQSDDMYGKSSSDMYGQNQSSPTIGYPEVYNSQGSSGVTETYGYYKSEKRTFTEQPGKRTYNEYLSDAGMQDSAQDAFVFKKPMMKVLPGSRNKTGQQQGNQNKGRGSQKNQRGRGGRNQQNKSGFSF